jgi:hypothetical protein
MSADERDRLSSEQIDIICEEYARVVTNALPEFQMTETVAEVVRGAISFTDRTHGAVTELARSEYEAMQRRAESAEADWQAAEKEVKALEAIASWAASAQLRNTQDWMDGLRDRFAEYDAVVGPDRARQRHMIPVVASVGEVSTR